MEVIMQSIQIIDYESNSIKRLEPPKTFLTYINKLISFLERNKSIRDYKTRSVNTEVISSILDIVNNQTNDLLINEKIESIAKRLLEQEIQAQIRVEHLDINVQKGSLIQALLYHEETEKYSYLLAKVQHTNFVDDIDFTFKSGFLSDEKKVWKTCIFDLDDLDSTGFNAKIYSSTMAKYWNDKFLELDEINSDEKNTNVMFKQLEYLLVRTIKRKAPNDYIYLRNSIIGYLRSRHYIDYDTMIDDIFSNYQPYTLDINDRDLLISSIKELPNRYEFDRQFNVVHDAIKAKITKIYEVGNGIQIKLLHEIENIRDTIVSEIDNEGKKFIKIRSDNDETFNLFKK